MIDESSRWRSTTILAVRHRGAIALGGDGQVTLGQTVMKADAVKIRKFREGSVLVGFAGSAADAFALLERFESRLKDYQGNVAKAATELAKDWRTDRALRRLEAMMIVADAKTLLLISGTGDVISPSDGVLGIGSGGSFAVASARALIKHANLSASDIVRESLLIAGELCVYTNQNIVVEELDCPS
jgi:ATP-dependent HslUV protease, peptidase subunit HslV